MNHVRRASVAPQLPPRRRSLAFRLIDKQTALKANAVSLNSTTTPASPRKKQKPIVPTRHDAPCDFFIVVGLENGKAVQARQEQDQQDQQRVRSTTSQDNVHQYHFDTTSMDLLLSEQRELSPTILDRYPPQDYTNATVDPMVPVFCMPLGIAPLDPLDTATFTASASPPNMDDNNNPVDQAKPSTTARQSLPAPTIHQFTLTTGDGSKVYGVCLTFYEAVTIGALHLRHPSVSQMLLDEVYYEMFEQWLLQPLDATNETSVLVARTPGTR